MHVQIPPTETENNISAIERAIERKAIEVDQARTKLAELQAELRGLNIALNTLGGTRK